MAKYSTGSDSGGSEGCELCGERSTDLTRATVAGATLQVCPSCADHDDATGREDRSTDQPRDADRTRRAVQNTARVADAATGDSTHWEQEGTNYDADQLPYLVADYDERARTAREDAGASVADLADDLDADEEDVRAVESGNASGADVGGSLIRALEDHLDVTLAE